MTLRLRQAVRALLLDPDDHLLLVRFEFPVASVWALPGGGLDDGESAETGLRRELHEELGLSDFELGPHIWNREHVIPMTTGHDGQQDRIHIVRTGRFEPVPTIGWDLMRAEHVHELRWWSIAEIGAAVDTLFAPRALFRLVSELVANGVPARPIDTGI
jgi:ADP-ribose pyrophosphatase YjhB (NUDIX family)